MKRGRCIYFCTLAILSLFLLSCLPSFDAQNLILNDPRVKAFLEENPNADITIVHFSAEESLTELEKFAEICSKSLTQGKELYKAELVDPTKGLKIIAYLDADTKVIDCVRRYGAEGKPVESSPAATPTPETSTEACGDGKIDGTCSKPEYANWQACTVQPDWKRGTWSGEFCDDGNMQEGDGCSSSCNLECTDSDGSNSGVKGIASGTIYDGTSRKNIEEQCTTQNGKSAVGEWSCPSSGIGILSILYHDCPGGCLDGACVFSSATAPAVRCGNGIVEGSCSRAEYADSATCLTRAATWTGEKCDDGNSNDNDDCTSTCLWKCTDSDLTGATAFPVGVKGTVHGFDGWEGKMGERTDSCVAGTPDPKTGAVVSKKVKEYYCSSEGMIFYMERDCSDRCEDGACSTQETAAASAPQPVPAALPATTPSCGNGVKESTEECDDGNVLEYDGCTNTCLLCSDSDGGRDFNVKGVVYHKGGGVGEDHCITRFGKETNDLVEYYCKEDKSLGIANTVCSSGCSQGACLPAPTPVCGNGMKEGSETCDDGNTANGDGCSSACQTERRLVY